MKSKIKILIVDDEEGMCRLLKSIVTNAGYQAQTFNSARNALVAFKSESFDIAIVDIKMPEMDGIQFLKECIKINKDFAVIMITAYGSIESAVETIKLGAFDYITKPFQAAEICVIIDKIIERKSLIEENLKLKRELDSLQHPENFIYTKESPLSEISRFIKKIAPTKNTVLITGESGTGKEVIAHYIHNNSPRKENPFITVQCSLLPESLLESELFGHRKGSFTGAISDKKGIFEEANSGTIFLDEIGDINYDVQGKLLRFIQEYEVRRIGENKSKIIDVRLIAATNKNLEQMVKDNTLREDLYYRLKVISVYVPPLRERKQDIPALVNYFINDINKKSGTEIEINRDAVKYLLTYHWPGNVRELKNCLETSAAICEDNQIQLNDIENSFGSRQKETMDKKSDINKLLFKTAKNRLIADFEKNYITSLLTMNKGNITSSAEEAGMDKKSFWRIMKKYEISHKNFK